jgi:hypothetical protein
MGVAHPASAMQPAIASTAPTILDRIICPPLRPSAPASLSRTRGPGQWIAPFRLHRSAPVEIMRMVNRAPDLFNPSIFPGKVFAL